jgi:hypothetical protein
MNTTTTMSVIYDDKAFTDSSELLDELIINIMHQHTRSLPGWKMKTYTMNIRWKEALRSELIPIVNEMFRTGKSARTILNSKKAGL